VIYQDGVYEITDTEMTQRFDADKVLLMEKFDPAKIITAVYYDHDKLQFTVKRFKIETTTLHNKFLFIKEGANNRLEAATTDKQPILVLTSGKGAQQRIQKMKIADFVEVMGWKAVGNKLADYNKSVSMDWEQKPKPAEDKGQTELF
jgi:topoisomerase-4 subunit A